VVFGCGAVVIEKIAETEPVTAVSLRGAVGKPLVIKETAETGAVSAERKLRKLNQFSQFPFVLSCWEAIIIEEAAETAYVLQFPFIVFC